MFWRGGIPSNGACGLRDDSILRIAPPQHPCPDRPYYRLILSGPESPPKFPPTAQGLFGRGMNHGSTNPDDEKSKSRELIEPEFVHDLRITSTEPSVVLPCSPHGTLWVDLRIAGNHPPLLYFLADQDFSNLWPCVHFLISSRTTLPTPVSYKLGAECVWDQGLILPVLT
jgi:hypothetical protein